jgi:predicted GNAT superfamily acetyltransferase
MSGSSEFTFRSLSTPEDYAACVELQRVTWGEAFTELVPPVILMLTRKVGGIAVGAFSEDELAGFVYGLTGFRDGQPVHWSHMLAVHPQFEGRGIGRRLKEVQREQLLEQGIKSMRWSFDPLVARNAHLNYNRLGAKVFEYVPNMYGTDTGSILHSGLGTDRFVVEWSLVAPSVEKLLAGTPPGITEAVSAAPIANTEEAGPFVRPIEGDLPDAPIVRIEIPSDIDQIKANSMELGKRWHSCTKRACLWYLERNYAVEGFYREPETGRCFYHLVFTQGAEG